MSQIITGAVDKIYARIKEIFDALKKRPKLTFALAISALLLFTIRKYQNKFIYLPVVEGAGKSPSTNPEPYRHPKNFGISASSDVEIKTEDNKILRGWLMEKGDVPSQRLIVYFHENAGNIGTRLPFVHELIERTKSAVLLIAYRGYSDSEGSPSEKGLKKDCKAIMNQAMKIAEQKQIPIVVFGRSLGGAAAVYTCSLPEYNKQMNGVILENTFTCMSDVIVNMYPGLTMLVKIILSFTLSNYWRSYQLINKIKRPILFIKSEHDELIPKDQMDKLQNLCEFRTYEYVIRNGTHNETWTINPGQYFDQINLFMSRI